MSVYICTERHANKPSFLCINFLRNIQEVFCLALLVEEKIMEIPYFISSVFLFFSYQTVPDNRRAVRRTNPFSGAFQHNSSTSHMNGRGVVSHWAWQSLTFY